MFFFFTAGGQFHHTILKLPFSIDQIFVELVLKNSVSFIRDFKSGILCQAQYLALHLYPLKKNLNWKTISFLSFKTHNVGSSYI